MDTTRGVDLDSLFGNFNKGLNVAANIGNGIASALNQNNGFDPNSRINMGQDANYNPYSQQPAYSQQASYGYGYGVSEYTPDPMNMANYPGISNPQYGM
jgi:hypothetical protein